LQPIKEAAYTIKRHWEGVLRWFKSNINNGAIQTVPISNGSTEAMNNNAKAVSQAGGYRTEKTFSLALIHCLGGLQLPQTTHKFL